MQNSIILTHLRLNNIYLKCAFIVIKQIQIQQIKQMGTNNSVISSQNWKSQWSVVYTHEQYSVVKNNKTGILMNLYKKMLRSSEINLQQQTKKIYERNAIPNAVKIHKIYYNNSIFSKCGTLVQLVVLTQHIIATLQELRQLDYDQINVIIYNACKTLSQLVTHYGLFNIKANMVAFTQKHEIKLWINEDLSVNSKPKSQQYCKQRIMLHKLINCVQREYYQGTFSQPFRTNLYSQRTFNDCMKFIVQQSGISQEQLSTNKIIIDDYQFRDKKNAENLIKVLVQKSLNKKSYNSPLQRNHNLSAKSNSSDNSQLPNHAKSLNPYSNQKRNMRPLSVQKTYVNEHRPLTNNNINMNKRQRINMIHSPALSYHTPNINVLYAANSFNYHHHPDFNLNHNHKVYLANFQNQFFERQPYGRRNRHITNQIRLF